MPVSFTKGLNDLENCNSE